jgi:hypothetical protein
MTIREYDRIYGRTRYFLYRLSHPAKQRGRKMGTKDSKPRMRKREVESAEVIAIRKRFNWTI